MIKLIFLDFDGVLNSRASFHMEFRKKKLLGLDTQINETLSEIACSNFNMILEAVPDAEIVISSAWRVFFTLDWLRTKLTSYGIDGKKVRGVTGRTLSGHRGREIREYLDDLKDAHPNEEIIYVVIDDNDGDLKQHFKERLVKTTWEDGLLLVDAQKAVRLLEGKMMTEKDLCREDDLIDKEVRERREATRVADDETPKP